MKQRKIHVKVGDNVIIISGFYIVFDVNCNNIFSKIHIHTNVKGNFMVQLTYSLKVISFHNTETH